MDYYKILNVEETATLKEIEQAYKDLSSFYNPENNYSKTEYKKYREINKAYEVLKDIKQREVYNLTVNTNDERHLDTTNTERLNIEEFKKEKQTINKDEKIYNLVRVAVPYICYLTKSYYEFDYDVCLSSSLIKAYGFTCYDNNSDRKERRHTRLLIEDRKVLANDTLFVFDFINKEDYEVKDNKITLNVLDNVDFNLTSDSESLHISEPGVFNFNNYVIVINKKDNVVKKKGIIVTKREKIFLNKEDYTFTYKEDDAHSLLINLDSDRVELDDLTLEVIKIENNDDLRVFFDKEVIRVNEKIFSVGGYINNKYVHGKELYADDNYLYIPSRVYKNKLRDYLWFRIVSPVPYILLPLIMFLIMGLTTSFLLATSISLVLYFIFINVMMEVKI